MKKKRCAAKIETPKPNQIVIVVNPTTITTDEAWENCTTMIDRSVESSKATIIFVIVVVVNPTTITTNKAQENSTMMIDRSVESSKATIVFVVRGKRIKKTYLITPIHRIKRKQRCIFFHLSSPVIVVRVVPVGASKSSEKTNYSIWEYKLRCVIFFCKI